MSIKEKIDELDVSETDRKLMIEIAEIAEGVIVKYEEKSKRHRSFRERMAASSFYNPESPRVLVNRRSRSPSYRQSGAFPARRQSDFKYRRNGKRVGEDR